MKNSLPKASFASVSTRGFKTSSIHKISDNSSKNYSLLTSRAANTPRYNTERPKGVNSKSKSKRKNSKKMLKEFSNSKFFKRDFSSIKMKRRPTKDISR